MSGAGGGSSKKSVGKYLHLKSFGEELKKFNVEYKLVNESDYVLGFPTKSLRKYLHQMYQIYSTENMQK